MSQLVTITSKLYDASGKYVINLKVKSRYKGSSRENINKTDQDGLFIFQASPNRTVEILAQPPNTKDYIVVKTINSSIVSSRKDPVKVPLPKSIEEYQQKKVTTTSKGIVTTLFKIIDSKEKILINFPVTSRPKGSKKLFERNSNEQGIVEVLSSPNRDIEILVLTSNDEFTLKSSVNSGNGSQTPIIIKLDEPYENFKSVSSFKIVDRLGNDYRIENTKIEIFYLENGIKKVLNTSSGKFSLQSMVGEKVKITVFKPDGKPLEANNYYSKRMKEDSNKLELDVDITEASTNQKEPTIEKQLDIKTCTCDRDLTLNEFLEILKGMRNSEKTLKGSTAILNLKCSVIGDKSHQALLNVLNRTMNKYNINTCIRKIHFLAQIYWESDRFRTTSEYASGKYLDPGKHADAEKNGNTQVGDGPRYKGRGFMQLTWRKNYKRYYSFIIKNIYDYKEVFPENITLNECLDRSKKYHEIVASNLFLAMDSAGWYWNNGVILRSGKAADINLQADKDDVNKISLWVNGGGNGRKERIEYWKELKKVLKYDSCQNKK